jgi:hypothetical protein
MANPFHHACSSAKRWGGSPDDYQAIHDWFDASKEFMPDFRHRALRHHAQGIFECERVFGHAIRNSAGRMIPVRWIGEQHVMEDCGRIPTIQDWFRHIRPERWMGEPPVKLETALLSVEKDVDGKPEERWQRHVGRPIGIAHTSRRRTAKKRSTTSSNSRLTPRRCKRSNNRT